MHRPGNGAQNRGIDRWLGHDTWPAIGSLTGEFHASVGEDQVLAAKAGIAGQESAGWPHRPSAPRGLSDHPASV